MYYGKYALGLSSHLGLDSQTEYYVSEILRFYSNFIDEQAL